MRLDFECDGDMVDMEVMGLGMLGGSQNYLKNIRIIRCCCLWR